MNTPVWSMFFFKKLYYFDWDVQSIAVEVQNNWDQCGGFSVQANSKCKNVSTMMFNLNLFQFKYLTWFYSKPDHITNVANKVPFQFYCGTSLVLSLLLLYSQDIFTALTWEGNVFSCVCHYVHAQLFITYFGSGLFTTDQFWASSKKATLKME